MDYSTGRLGDTATAGTDYIAVSNGTLTFTPGQTSRTFTVQTELDSNNTDGGNLNFGVNISVTPVRPPHELCAEHRHGPH